MADNKLEIQLLVRDEVSAQMKKIESQVMKSNQKMKKSFTDVAVKVAAFTFAIKKAHDTISVFVKNAAKVENLNVRLRVLLGSVEAGNKVFEDMADLAGRVPQTYDEIMESATALAGVVRRGSEDINKLMPIILDISAATGIGVQETTSQMIRMYSAGAAAADMFRDRGVLAALGFKAGVSVSAEETIRRIEQQWADGTGKMVGAIDLLAETWDGKTSQMADAWFKFTAAYGQFIIKSPVVSKAIEDMIQLLNELREASGVLNQTTQDKSIFEKYWDFFAPLASAAADMAEAWAVVKINEKNAQIALEEYHDTMMESISLGEQWSGIFNNEEQIAQRELFLDSLREEMNLRQAIQAELDLYNQKIAESNEPLNRVKEELKRVETQTKTMTSRIEKGFEGALSGLISGTMSAKEAFQSLGKTIVKAISDFIAQQIIAQTIGKAIRAAETALLVAMGAQVTAAWTPAAIAVSLASFGSNAGPAMAGMASASAFGTGLFAGTGGFAKLTRRFGGDDLVSRPTIFLAGEAGPERVKVTPALGDTPSSDSQVNVYIDTPVVNNERDIDLLAETLGFETENAIRTARGI